MAAPRRSDRRPNTVSRCFLPVEGERHERGLSNGNRERLKSPLWLIYLLARSANRRRRRRRRSRRRRAVARSGNRNFRDAESPPSRPFTLEVAEKSMIHYRVYRLVPRGPVRQSFRPAPSYPFHIHPDSSWFTLGIPQRVTSRAPYSLSARVRPEFFLSVRGLQLCDTIAQQPAGRDPPGDHVAATWWNSADDKPTVTA